jgi:EmrB/QacA subfamily drug resistance transporter
MLAVLLTGQFMALLDVFVVNVALPTIATELHASGASLQLVVGGYVIAYAMLLITGARLGALYGRRRMYLTGVIVFTVASLACGLAPTIAVLVAFRFVQGAGAALMVPQIMSSIQMHFIGAARAKALSAYGVVLSAGAVAGLIVGGIVVSANLFGATWRPVFLVNVPLGIAVSLLVRRLVPADQPRSAQGLDLRGLVVATPAVCLVVLPLVIGHSAGWPAWTFACIAGGLALFAVFVMLERRVAGRKGDPLVNLSVLRAPGLGPALLTLACMQIAYGGFLFAFTLHLQAGLGYSALRAGFTYLPMGVAFGLAGFYWRKLAERVHAALTPVGLGLCALGYLGIAVATGQTPNGGAALWIALVVLGIGMGLSASPLLTQALVYVPAPAAADASGLLTTTMQLGQVLGVAALGTVFLSLREHRGHAVNAFHSSAAALSATAGWLVALSLCGAVTAVFLMRAVLRAQARRRTEVTAPAVA